MNLHVFVCPKYFWKIFSKVMNSELRVMCASLQLIGILYKKNLKLIKFRVYLKC